MRRRDKMIEEEYHDPYYEGKKYKEPTVCKVCGAVFKNGRWVWHEGKVEGADEGMCPACRRIREKYPAGVVILEGNFIKDSGKKTEIMNLIKNVEEKAKNLHPLERIMEIKENDDGGIEILTTDPHLARRIGESVAKAYKGEFKIQYLEEEKFVRVYWRRD